MKYAVVLTLLSFFISNASYAETLDVKVDSRSIKAEAGMPIVSYANVLDKATPSVVTVYTSRIVTSRRSSEVPDILRQFGFPTPQAPSQDSAPRERRESLGVGSGVIISEDGYIITNHHVISGARGRAADEIIVRLNDETEFVAELIGSDQKTDVAVLKIEAEEPLPALTLADSEHLRVGDVVFAIGNPLDVGLTATQGIVSATGRNSYGILGPGAYEDFIQTDAAINFGNSGGALIDAWGRLVGINTAIVSGTGGSIGIGFAIPVNMALNVATNLIDNGEVPRGMLGLLPDNLTRDMADAFGLDSTRGALVNQVQPDSPADKAGIRHGDIITKVDDVEIDSAPELRLTVSQIMPGTEVDVTLIRMSEEIVIPVKLGSLNGSMSAVEEEKDVLEGVRLRALDSESRDSLSIPVEIDGVLITGIGEDSPFVEKLEERMVLIEVNGEVVNTVEDVAEHLKEGANRFYVWAAGVKRFVILKI